MGSLLVLAGVDPSVAVAAVIICRLATLWFAVAIGLIFVVGLELSGIGKQVSMRQAATEPGPGD